MGTCKVELNFKTNFHFETRLLITNGSILPNLFLNPTCKYTTHLQNTWVLQFLCCHQKMTELFLKECYKIENFKQSYLDKIYYTDSPH